VETKDMAGRDELPRALPRIRLHHGQALWVLIQLGFQGAASDRTFKEYIKSLRKLGTPFARGEVGPGRRSLANYSYYHLMELALALTLRVYHVVPDSVLTELVKNRQKLYRLYRRAYTERSTGRGAQILLKIRNCEPVSVSGVFLDLQMNFSGGQLTSFGPVNLISPVQAIEIFTNSDIAARSFLPIRLSPIAEKVVALALKAPLIRRGPQKKRSPAKPHRSARL
jgi:hypothetical protein